MKGKNIANVTNLFKNTHPKECPIKKCLINQKDCFNPDMSRLLNTYPLEDSTTKEVKDIMFYANTTNGPKYDDDFCVVCNNRAEHKQ